MRCTPGCEARQSTGREGGFTLVEALVGAVVVLLVGLGTLPMFTRAMAHNRIGKDATEVSNLAVDRLEGLVELPFNHPDLTLAAGTELTTEEYFWIPTGTWEPYPLPDSLVGVKYVRSITVRQYALAALDDGLLETSEALSWDAPPTFVHLKEIEVRVEQQGALFGPSKRIAVRTLKVR